MKVLTKIKPKAKAPIKAKAPRKPRVDGTKFALEAAAALAQPLPEPPLPLSPNSVKYWQRIFQAKRATAWTDIDLDTAWGLAEDFAKLEEARLALQTEGPFYSTKSGEIKPHPALKVVEEIERRIQATKRHLQIHASATTGKSDHQGPKNEAFRRLGATLAAKDDLFASPKQ